MAKVGQDVIVKEPKLNEIWSHSFVGKIIDIVEKTETEGNDIVFQRETFIIEDQDSDCFAMERDRFETISSKG